MCSIFAPFNFLLVRKLFTIPAMSVCCLSSYQWSTGGGAEDLLWLRSYTCGVLQAVAHSLLDTKGLGRLNVVQVGLILGQRPSPFS